MTGTIDVDLNQIAQRIRERIRRTSMDIIDTGNDLIAVKNKLDHGEFLGWLDREFGMTARTAQRYVQSAEWAKDKNDIVSHLPPATIYLLAAPSTPTEMSERVVADILTGRVIDHAALRNEVRQHKRTSTRTRDQVDYVSFRNKLGIRVRRKQQDRIDEFLGSLLSFVGNADCLEEIYVERLNNPEHEQAYVAALEQAQRDLKRFLNRVRATYADRGDQ